MNNLLIYKKQMIICLSVLFVFVLSFLYLSFCGIYIDYKVEAGSEFVGMELRRFPLGSVELIDDEIDTTILSTYDIEVRYLFNTHKVQVEVVDTIPPVGEGKILSTNYLNVLEAIDCVDNIIDTTDVVASFIDEIDYTTDSEQLIRILLTDEGNNTTEINCTITVVQDITAPTISGDSTYRSLLGDSISYRSLVTVEDDSGLDVDLDIDNSDVDINKVGSYKVIYTATDYAGNQTTREITIVIYEEEPSTNTTTTLEDKAQAILDSITTSSMSKTSIATAIHTWCYNNISYNGINNASSWRDAAYTGLTYRAGNCYTFFATAKILLTQAGIPTIDITAPQHYWNLVDVGTGWLHFDTTIAADGIKICLWTSEQLANYHASSYLPRHDYDPSLYPTIN